MPTSSTLVAWRRCSADPTSFRSTCLFVLSFLQTSPSTLTDPSPLSHPQLNKNTEKSFGEKQFGWMKDGSVLVNTAR